MYYIEPERGAIEDLVATYPENTPGVKCKCYQGGLRYTAAVKYVLAECGS